jgi:nuclear pore complex protein Nup98-Nup96
VLRHQASSWELLHALFSALPAEIEDEDARAEAAGAGAMNADGDGDNDGDGDGDGAAEGEGEGGAPPRLHALASLQRRAALSRWVRDRSRARAEADARAARAPPARLLALLSGHQLAAAAATAAAAGDVRLATLLAGAGASAAARGQVAAQLGVWREAGMEALVDPGLARVYQLLAGRVDDVIPTLNLDWRRALGAHLWYAAAPTAGVAAALDSYVAAVEAGAAPPPAPLYAERGGAGAEAAGGALDVAFELLSLFVARGAGEEAGGGRREAGRLLRRVLRPAGVTPDPLDYSFSWHLLGVLRAVGAAPDDDDDAGGAGDATRESAAAAGAAAMSFAAQLQAAGGLARWAVYAAMHLPDDRQRGQAVRALLEAHCPEWEAEAGAEAFFVDRLRVPAAWLAGARALWAGYRGDEDAELAAELAAGAWARAHALLAAAAAPRWLLAGGAAAGRLADALAALEPRRGDVEAAAGAGAWARGAGLYASFLYLRQLYAALGAAGGGGAAPELEYEERLEACAALGERLNAAAAADAAAGPGGARGAALGAVDARRGALRRAAFARMAAELGRWVLGDAHGARAVPGPHQAALASGLRALPYAAAAAAVQVGAVSLAASIA